VALSVGRNFDPLRLLRRSTLLPAVWTFLVEISTLLPTSQVEAIISKKDPFFPLFCVSGCSLVIFSFKLKRMTFPQAIFLSFIQGLTEFLPVSSSGHLALFQQIFGLEPPLLFDVLVHIGTLGAVLFFFRKKIAKLKTRTLGLILVGTIPAVIFGLFLRPYLEVFFASSQLVALGFIFTSVLLFSAKIPLTKKPAQGLTLKSSLFIGFFQSLAILPGISRSGSTISAGLWQKIRPEEAFEFSFLLAIPAMLGALVLETPDLLKASPAALFQGFLGMIIAGGVGYFALSILKKLLASQKFWKVGFYCLFLGLALFFLNFSG
jgi:undecaprenyl-diphosphatase